MDDEECRQGVVPIRRVIRWGRLAVASEHKKARRWFKAPGMFDPAAALTQSAQPTPLIHLQDCQYRAASGGGQDFIELLLYQGFNRAPRFNLHRTSLTRRSLAVRCIVIRAREQVK